ARTIQIFSGRGDGTFSVPLRLDAREVLPDVSEIVFDGPLPRLLVSDLNRDGHPDLVLFGAFAAGVLAYVSNAKGELQAGVQIFEPVFAPPYFSQALGIVDVNRDGIPDVVVCAAIDSGQKLAYAPGRGDGGFRSLELTTLDYCPQSVASA